MPGYKLELWDKTRCLSLNIDFINDAIQLKKYAFAADVVRVIALYLYGGIYLDTDVILKKSLEPLFCASYISFIEVRPNLTRRKIKYNKLGKIEKVKDIGLQAAVMCSEKGHPFLNDLIYYYKNKRFNKQTMKYFFDVIAPDIQASLLIPYGFQYKDVKQKLKNNILIYPSFLIDKNNSDAFGIHICLSSWVPQKTVKEKITYKIKRITYLILHYFKLI